MNRDYGVVWLRTVEEDTSGAADTGDDRPASGRIVKEEGITNDKDKLLNIISLYT